MCGIAGILHFDGKPASTTALKKMTDAISHRGPDSEGTYINGALGLGHRRLSIIDLSPLGHQPMATKDGRYIISYNGEVYNYNELRIELESLGYGFKSQTDTEVVLYAWQEWKKEAVLRFNGMFAFSIWDNLEKKLYLVRDRFGIKPLYYGIWENTLLFASEQKAILAHSDSRREIDLEAVYEYFTFQNIFSEKTFIKNIKLLPSANILCFDVINSLKMTQHSYWDYSFKDELVVKDYCEYKEELDRLLRQAVSRQLVTDVEIGSFLSGGMDSGTLTALAARELPYIKTFTCGFDLSSVSGIEVSFDERVKAEAMSALFKTEHYEMVLKSGDMERVMPKLTWHIEEPRVGQSYPNYYASRLASKFVKVILSGAGGDELFGGYPWRYYRATNCVGFEDYVDKYYLYWQRLIPNSSLKKAFSPVWKDVNQVWTRDIFRDVFKHHSSLLEKPEDYINHSLYFEAKTFLHGLFVVEDKVSMAHGLETRVPFMDNELVEFAMKCPIKYKLNNLQDVVRLNENDPGIKTNKFFQRTNDGKQILRDVMSKYIPDEIVRAEKQGFSAPDATWFKGQSMNYVKSTIYNDKALMYNYLDKSYINELVDDHLKGHNNRRLLIWSLLSFENTLKNFFS